MCARRVESSVVRRDLHMYLGAQNGSNTTRAERGADRGAHHIDMMVAMINIGKKPRWVGMG